jgi:serine/threonine-protein kinase
MTLADASPDQLARAPLGTATDIYSLGVVLYELLAGVRPFDHLDTDHERANAIVTGEIIPPSRQARTATHAPIRRIPRDLDAIVLKALRPKPEQRYASVGALAADLRRYLVALPVQARRGQWGYRARRFVWRNRWGLGIAALLIALVATFLIDRVTQLRRIRLERTRAQAVASFTAGLCDYAGALSGRGNAVTVHEMLDRGAEELQKREDLSAPVKGELLLTMGQAYNSLRLEQPALPLLQAAQPLLASADALERARLQGALGATQYQLYSHPESIAAFTQAIALLRSAPGDHTEEIADYRIRIAVIHTEEVDVPVAQTIAEFEAIVAELENAAHPAEKMLIDAYGALAYAYYIADTDNMRAVSLDERAVDLATHLYGASDQRTWSTRIGLAQILWHTDPARSVAIMQELIANYERFDATPSIARANRFLYYGIALRYAGRYAQAAKVIEQALAMARELAGTQYYMTRVAIDELSLVYLLSGQPDKAQALLGAALADFAAAAEKGSANDRTNYAAALARLGESERMRHHYAQAAAHFAQAQTILAKLNVDGGDEILNLLEWTARLNIDQHDADAARATLARYDTLMQSQSPPRAQRQAASRELHESLTKIAR